MRSQFLSVTKEFGNNQLIDSHLVKLLDSHLARLQNVSTRKIDKFDVIIPNCGVCTNQLAC